MVFGMYLTAESQQVLMVGPFSILFTYYDVVVLLSSFGCIHNRMILETAEKNLFVTLPKSI